MINSIRHSSRLAILVLLLTLFATGCKSKKKAMEAAAAEKARIEQQEALARQEREAQQRLKDEADAADRARRDAEALQNERNASAPKTRLSNYFSSIAGAENAAAANNSINEALTLFASPETPVLIVISEAGGQKDYDKPTTIRNYLNYLKDQRKNSNPISNLTVDNAGKITEVELKKN
jgi:hypothetical protein